jgi:hypothetical protein
VLVAVGELQQIAIERRAKVQEFQRLIAQSGAGKVFLMILGMSGCKVEMTPPVKPA